MKRFVVLIVAVLLLATGCQSSGGAPDKVTIEVTVSDSGVTPNGEQVEVRKGGEVTLKATSTKAAMLHVHGYDVELNVEPNTPAEVTFTADKPGSFEIETHDPAALVAQLVVRS